MAAEKQPLAGKKKISGNSSSCIKKHPDVCFCGGIFLIGLVVAIVISLNHSSTPSSSNPIDITNTSSSSTGINHGNLSASFLINVGANLPRFADIPLEVTNNTPASNVTTSNNRFGFLKRLSNTTNVKHPHAPSPIARLLRG